MKRTPLPPRTKPLPRSTKPIPRSPLRRHARTASETKRVYGPEAFAEHVHHSPCLWCGLEGEAIQQAHLRGVAGTSMKASWLTTGPMCGPAARPRNCHDRWDGRALPAFTHNERAEILRRQAAFVDSWLATAERKAS